MQQSALVNGNHTFIVRWQFGDEMLVEEAVNEWVRRGVISWFDALVLIAQVFNRLEVP
jgi:hypothetical protein